MAQVKIKMPEEFLLKVSRLGNKTDEIIEKTLKTGGKIVLEVVKANLKSVIGKDLKFKKRSSGELISSLGISPADVDRNGIHNIKVGFNKPRFKQYEAKKDRSYYLITNAMIANVIEYGKSGQKPKPFLKPAKTKSIKSCIDAMKSKLDSEIKNI